ncbi:zinc metallopeptidase, M23 family [Campylobacter showae]|uniref:Peptidase, M23 family n=1 Tax=Campylobacter showae RM3277 TaxID=553219 RepID=C6RDH7_9BACT|nr:M23 family metallopeptidase [Campylobacter showae]EET80538.1 peptidase, M23 family [Campylobacter showae RM3277]QCD49251.1 zinc metallopeptidase, M23 family [Campylobacter showae]
MKKIFLAVLICLNLSAKGQGGTPSETQTIVNGDVEIVQVEAKFAGNLSIDGKKKRWLSVPGDENLKFAVVTASYRQKGEIKLVNGLKSGDEKIVFKIVEGEYKKEKITVEGSKVTPPKDVLKRIEEEREEANKIYATANVGLKFNSKFILPMSSAVTSAFGTARVFNGTLKSYHGGTDFRAAVGTSVIAANDGVVVIAKDRYYAGGSVVIDHGEGIYTQYYHLSALNVKVGQSVKKGDTIALSGSSGRVSGPHLHFGVIAGGVQVNPLNFVKKINEILN